MPEILKHEGIDEHLRFMVLEVIKQLENTRELLDTGNTKLLESIESRDDYIDNFKSVIENKSYSRIHSHSGEGAVSKRTVDILRAANTVSSNLERIADHAVNIVDQTRYLKDIAFIKRYQYGRFFDEILTALNLVYHAVTSLDMGEAFRICRAESNLDMLYKVQFDRILNELRSGMETENLITSHLILRYLERIGDALLNVGEAVIFAVMGEKFKIRQYEALKETMSVSGVDLPISDVEFQSIWGTRSGCRIGKVSAKASARSGKGAASTGVLFKEGNGKKLLQEKENIERWEALMPGLPPKVLAHQQDGTQASLLIEFLGGCTYQEVVLTAEWPIVENATFLVEEILGSVWEATNARANTASTFVSQLKDRLPDVYRLHPDLAAEAMRVGGHDVLDVPELIDIAVAVETELPAPYTVFIHGDYNINNIVYDHAHQQLHYIDLHRSKQADPLQDVSVFIVSNFRLPIFERELRSRLNWVARSMYHFARSSWREKYSDANFDARLALGLVRSFISSARFELNPEFAKVLFLRGVYLLERLAAHRDSGQPFSEFVLREDVIVH